MHVFKYNLQKCIILYAHRFFSKAKKAAMTPLAPPPAPPTVPRLVEDVVPDDRDDPEIILNTTTVSLTLSMDQAGMIYWPCSLGVYIGLHHTNTARRSYLHRSYSGVIFCLFFSLPISSITILWGSLLGRSPQVCGSAGSPLTTTSMIQPLTSPKCAVSLLLWEMTEATYTTG